jgi:hypothetical protein
LAVSIKFVYSLALKEDRMLRIVFYIKWRRNDRMKCFIMYATLKIICGDKGTENEKCRKCGTLARNGKINQNLSWWL